MGDLFKPTVQQTGPTRAQRQEARIAERERIDVTRDRAARETERLFRLFGARNALGLSTSAPR